MRPLKLTKENEKEAKAGDYIKVDILGCTWYGKIAYTYDSPSWYPGKFEIHAYILTCYRNSQYGDRFRERIARTPYPNQHPSQIYVGQFGITLL